MALTKGSQTTLDEWALTANTAFNITLSNGSQVSGWVQYYKE